MHRARGQGTCIAHPSAFNEHWELKPGPLCNLRGRFKMCPLLIYIPVSLSMPCPLFDPGAHYS